MNMRIRPAMSSGLAVALLSFVVSAQVRADVNVLPSLQVTDRFETPLHLEQRNDTGSRLGLTAFETPATVNVIDQEQMQALGLRTMTEAYRAAPGITAGNHPAEPGVTSMRGFSRSATGYLIDGIPAIDPLLVSRNYDTWNFERIEVLKGPASVLHGTGALAGAINVVTRKPRLGADDAQAAFGYGSFGSVRAGVGGNKAVGDRLALRGDFSYSRSDGYVDDTDSRTTGVTTGLLFTPTDRVSLALSFDYFHDESTTPYEGTPLLPAAVALRPSGVVRTADGRVIDRSVRERNYNVRDGIAESDSYWLRGSVDVDLSERWRFVNELNLYSADRDWINSEDFTYNAGTGLLDRTTTKILHDHEFWSNRAYFSFDGELSGMRNRFSAGVEYVATDFGTVRRFGSVDAVDPFAPDRGLFPTPDDAVNFDTRQDFDSEVETRAVFVDNALNLTPEWILLAGLRYEDLDLDRRIDNLNTGVSTTFGRNFHSLSWRFGTVYDLTADAKIFAQYNRAVSPIGSLLLSSLANASFDLSSGTSVEVGIKSLLWGGRAVLTAALYQVEQDDILTRDPATPALVVQGGSQRARGMEVELALTLTPQWQLGLNGAILDPEFTTLRDAAGNDLAGKRPSNVSKHTFNLHTSYALQQLPLTMGLSVQGVGDFYTDNANTIRVDGHARLDAMLAYRLSHGTLTLRGRNLTDEFYAEWSGYSASQVYLAAPRSFELSWSAAF